jgi:hypothetical protein
MKTRRLTVERLESRALLATLPLLSSDPAATAKLFLDFDGNFEAVWGAYSNVSTPAFDTDGNPTDYSADELARIDEIFRRVAEDYLPFNLDVTTVDPGNRTNLITAHIAIGGSYSDWYGTPAGGVAFTGGFYSGQPNTGFVFADSHGDNPKLVAEGAAHEAGHLFGLSHQALWSGGVLVSPYRDGPIMGNSLSTEPSDGRPVLRLPALFASKTTLQSSPAPTPTSARVR